ncbi:MAG: lysophospholipid acyltransferase family protein [Thermovenabulum sp.]|uniref:lysophospholipid acyltransferase family protein n=1 Tax=Thermovenabulum sp. TaxID=3100335 RepID=UPI003C7CC406
MPIVGSFLSSIGAVPVQNESNELAGIRAALRVLEQGKTLALFPEGRVCNHDGLCPFQPGWAYLALKTGVPVVPSIIPRRGKIYMQIAAPWTLKKVQRPRQEILEDLNAKLFSQIDQMLKNL